MIFFCLSKGQVVIIDCGVVDEFSRRKPLTDIRRYPKAEIKRMVLGLKE